MNREKLKSQARRSAINIKFAGALWMVAMVIVMVAAVAWGVLGVMTGDYFTNSKSVRDAAEAGSAILSQQGSIEAVKDWVLPFAFLGLATFLLGFGFAFANILSNVRLRGNTMAVVLPALKQRDGECTACAEGQACPAHR